MRWLAEASQSPGRLFIHCLSGALLIACCGCEPPSVSPEELGKVVLDPAQVPGAQKHFGLPELKGGQVSEHDHEHGHDHDHDHGAHGGPPKGPPGGR
jgi:hypothetical protein